MVMQISVQIKALKMCKAIADKMRIGAGHKLNKEGDMPCCMLLRVTGQPNHTIPLACRWQHSSAQKVKTNVTNI